MVRYNAITMYFEKAELILQRPPVKDSNNFFSFLHKDRV